MEDILVLNTQKWYLYKNHKLFELSSQLFNLEWFEFSTYVNLWEILTIKSVHGKKSYELIRIFLINFIDEHSVYRLLYTIKNCCSPWQIYIQLYFWYTFCCL